MAIKYSLDYLKEIAAPFTRRIDFKNAYPKEYYAAVKRGIIDDVCSHMPKILPHSLEELKERARPYKQRTEFLKNDRSAYVAAQKHGWLDIVCEHMPTKYKRKKTTNEKYSDDDLERIASGYYTKSEFMDDNPNAYAIALKRKLIGKICKHMKVLQNFFTIDECIEEASKYDYRKAFEKGSPKHYDYARRHGWLDEVCADMEPKRQSWPKAKCIETASLFETIQEWRTAFPSAYEKCHRKGWLEEVTSHMKQTKRSRTKDECQQVASNYKTRMEFKNAEYACYFYAQSHGWLDEICAHMERVGDVYWRMIYVYEFADNHAYVGLTCDFKRRDWQHLNEEEDPVCRHLQKCSEYKLIKITDYIPKEEAAKLEDDYIVQYRNNGWKMLNTRRGGGLGFPRKQQKKREQ